MPERFQALHLYKLAFRQPIKFSNFSPRVIRVFGGSYLIWGISTDGDYQVFVYVLSEANEERQKAKSTSQIGAQTQTTAVGITVIIVGILSVLGLGLSIILFKQVTEVFGAGGLGITLALGIGVSGFLIFKKLR